MLKVSIKTAVYDFEWVLKVINSSENPNHFGVAQKCFHLWEKKHVKPTLSFQDLKTINKLRSNFWAIFKNKSVNFIKS